MLPSSGIEHGILKSSITTGEEIKSVWENGPPTTKDEEIPQCFFRKTSTLTHRKDDSKDMKSELGSVLWALWARMKLVEKGEMEGSVKHRIGWLLFNF